MTKKDEVQAKVIEIFNNLKQKLAQLLESIGQKLVAIARSLRTSNSEPTAESSFQAEEVAQHTTPVNRINPDEIVDVVIRHIALEYKTITRETVRDPKFRETLTKAVGEIQ